MADAVCSTCGLDSVVLIDTFDDGSLFGFCLNCDEPGETVKEKVYINHCWKCGFPINSRVDQRSPRYNKGFICRRCGCDLQGPARHLVESPLPLDMAII